jgi:predicted alpha/beta hydrolase family esterase
VNAGDPGHIDAESGYGPWPEGERLLAKVMARSAARQCAVLIGLAVAG